MKVNCAGTRFRNPFNYMFSLSFFLGSYKGLYSLMVVLICCEFFLKIFFDVDHFKVFIKCITILLLSLCFGFLTTRHVGSQFPDQGSNQHPCIGRQSLKHWATWEVQICCELCFFGYLCHFTLQNIILRTGSSPYSLFYMPHC